MLAKDELRDPDSCINKAAEDEPVFVLRGQDYLAPYIVREWVARANFHGAPANKIIEALAVADAMEAWPTRKLPD